MHDHNNTLKLPADTVIVGIDWAADQQRRFPEKTIAVAPSGTVPK